MTVCIFAASSSRVREEFNRVAAELGVLLAKEGIEVAFGGGGIGLMGKLADAVRQNGGKITGVIPAFMEEEGWGHKDLNDMIITRDMSERKKKLFEMSDAVVALPGGVGTLEELAEAITLKQLSLFHGPVVILNTLGFYDSLLAFFDAMVAGNFLREEHKAIWQTVNTPEEVILALRDKGRGNEKWRSIAKI